MAMVVKNTCCEQPHTWSSITANGLITGHDELHGDVLYGVDTIVHPDMGGMGVGTALIRARIALAQEMGLRLLRGFTRLPGYATYSDYMSFESYAEDIRVERRTEPALRMLKKCGFKIHDVVRGYVDNDRVGLGHAAVMILELEQQHD